MRYIVCFHSHDLVMSRASKLTLAGTSLFAATTIVFVHFQQKFEKEVCPSFHAQIRITPLTAHQAMHQGVVRDMEQQRVKKERQLDFDMQRALEEEYRKGQTVTTDTPSPALSPGSSTRQPTK